MRVKAFRVLGLAAVVLGVLATASVALGAGVPVEAGKAPAGVFEASNGCGCHASFVEQWALSMHAKALTDPIYLAKLEEGNKATKGAIGPFCNTCHGPAATMMGEMAKGQASSPGGRDAIACDWCHHVSGIKPGDPGNTSQLVDPAGPRRAQLKDPNAPHPAAYSALHDSAEFCGGCHNVNHPANGMHLESTYREWKASSYSAAGVTCQDCHMTRIPGERGPSAGQASGGAPQRDNIYQMIFGGAQVELGNTEYAKRMLESAATLDVTVPEVVEAGEEAEIAVTVTNSGAGHYLPTGLTEVREMWLETTAENAAGEPVKLGERRFGTVLQDTTGKAPVELWEATAIKSDDRIPPEGSVSDTFTFAMPDEADVSNVKVALLYRSAPDELAAKAGVKNPVTEMAVVTKAVYASKTAYAKAQRAADADGGSSPSAKTIGIVVAVLMFAAVVVFVSKARQRG